MIASSQRVARIPCGARLLASSHSTGGPRQPGATYAAEQALITDDPQIQDDAIHDAAEIVRAAHRAVGCEHWPTRETKSVATDLPGTLPSPCARAPSEYKR